MAHENMKGMRDSERVVGLGSVDFWATVGLKNCCKWGPTGNKSSQEVVLIVRQGSDISINGKANCQG